MHTVRGNIIEIPPGETRNAELRCPPGEIATGGGYHATPEALVYQNQPLGENGWIAIGRNIATDGGPEAIVAIVKCMGASPP